MFKGLYDIWTSLMLVASPPKTNKSVIATEARNEDRSFIGMFLGGSCSVAQGAENFFESKKHRRRRTRRTFFFEPSTNQTIFDATRMFVKTSRTIRSFEDVLLPNNGVDRQDRVLNSKLTILFVDESCSKQEQLLQKASSLMSPPTQCQKQVSFHWTLKVL
jgi:hypothetical protein